MLIGGLDRDPEPALRLERFLIASGNLNISLLTPYNLLHTWLKDIT